MNSSSGSTGLTDRDIREMIVEADLEGDKTLSYQEFKAIFK